jgi:hypothetical protein
MNEQERWWREHVATAAQRAADRLRRLDDPQASWLLDDLEELRERLMTELAADEA